MDAMEEWRRIPGAWGFWASSEGRIWADPVDGVRKEGLRHQTRAPKGYRTTAVRWTDHTEGAYLGTVTVGVHVLVALAFHGPRPPWCIPDHINNVHGDNRAVNLEWISYSENKHRAWSFQRGTTVRKTKAVCYKCWCVRASHRPDLSCPRFGGTWTDPGWTDPHFVDAQAA